VSTPPTDVSVVAVVNVVLGFVFVVVVLPFDSVCMSYLAWGLWSCSGDRLDVRWHDCQNSDFKTLLRSVDPTARSTKTMQTMETMVGNEVSWSVCCGRRLSAGCVAVGKSTIDKLEKGIVVHGEQCYPPPPLP